MPKGSKTYTVRDQFTNKELTFEWFGEKEPTKDDLIDIFSAAQPMRPETEVIGTKPAGGLLGLLGLLGVKEQEVITHRPETSELPAPVEATKPEPEGVWNKMIAAYTQGANMEPGLIGTLVNPAEIAAMVATGGITAVRQGLPVAKTMVDWGLYGGPSIYKGVRGGVSNFLKALASKATEARIPAAKTTPIAFEEASKLLPPATKSIEEIVRESEQIVSSKIGAEEARVQAATTKGVTPTPATPTTPTMTNIGYRGIHPSDIPFGIGTEGEGLYVARNKGFAEGWAGEGGQIESVVYREPRNPLIVEEEPLYILRAEKEIFSPIKDSDSAWTRLNKQAAQNVKVLKPNNFTQQDVSHELTRLIKSEGYDAVRVIEKGRGASWDVLLDDSLVESRGALSPHKFEAQRVEGGKELFPRLTEGEKFAARALQPNRQVYLDGLIEKVKKLEITGRIRVENLSTVEQQYLISKGATFDVDRMGKPLLGYSQNKRIQDLREKVTGRDKLFGLKPGAKELEEARKMLKPLAPELTKEEFDILKSEEGLVNLEVLKTPMEKFRAQLRSGLEYVQSPYYVLSKDATGTGMAIYRRLEEADRAKAMFLKRSREERLGKIKITPDSESATKVGDLLDQYDNEFNIPAFKWGALSTDEKLAFKFYRQKWDEAADVLIKKGLLDSKRKIKSYLFRIFDKDTIYNAAKNEYEYLLNEQAIGGIEAKQTAVLKDRLAKLKNMVEAYEKTGTILYDYLPKELQAPFLKTRSGAQGYSLDVVKAYDLYESYFSRKIFDEPAMKDAVSLLKNMPLENRPYARWFLRSFIGMERSPKINDLVRTFTTLEYAKDLGFNLRSAVVNSTQNLNTIVDIGPRWTSEGAYRALFDPEAKALWKASGHSADVPGLRYGMMAKGAEKAMRVAGYLFDKAELGNRMVAYTGGYYKALSEGKSPALARIYADDIVRRTQFMYGRTGAPRAMQLPLGPAMMQFGTFSVKELELFTTWAKENPAKLLSYLVIASGTGEGLKALGFDMSNALGIGVDWAELGKAFYDLGKGQGTAAKIHANLGLPKIPGLDFGIAGSGIFPTGAAPLASTVGDVLRGEWIKGLTPVAGQRLYQTVQAFREGQLQGAYGESGYPIRDITTGYARTFESPWELIQRNLIARPSSEARGFKEAYREDLTQETLTNLKQEALIAYGRGNESKFNKLRSTYNLSFTEADFQRLYLNRFTTPTMRKQLEALRSKQGIMFKQSIGEKVEPNMP